MHEIVLRAVSLIAFIAACTMVARYVGQSDYSVGVDAGIHAALAEQLKAYGTWPLPAHSFLSNIAHYPPAAHLLGIALGWLSDSSFSGMLLANALAMIIICLSLVYLMRRVSVAETIGGITIFLIAAFLLRKHRFLSGNEVVANFFYAQFVGTSALLVGFIFLERLRTRFPVWLAIAALTTHLVGWFFPLSAIQLAIAASALRLRLCERLGKNTPHIIEAVICGLTLTITSVLHPTMIDMAAISRNDGGISISTATLAISTAYLCLVGVPTLIVISRREMLLRSNALAALCIGVAAPCLLQFLLFALFDLGSSYAVKKSGFLIGTLSLVVFSSLAMEWQGLKKLVRSLTWPRFLPYANSLTAPAVLAIMIIIVFYGRSSTPASAIARYDGQLKRLLEQPDATELMGRTISLNSDFDSHTNQVVGFSLLQPGGSVQLAQGALLPPRPKLIKAPAFAIMTARSTDDLALACVLLKHDLIVAVHATCLTDISLPNSK